MAVSKICFSKLLSACCLLIIYTILSPQISNAQTWPCAGGYTKIWENCGNYLGGEGCNPGDVDVGNYTSPMCGNGEFSHGDRCCPPSASVNGSCGSANGVAVGSAPSSNLCSAGSASAVSGSGPWSWTCNGSGGGSNASCSAPLSAPPSCTWQYSGGVSSGCGAYPDCSSNTESAVTGTACSTNGAQCFGGNRMMCTGFKETCVCSPVVNGSCGTSNGGTFPNATPPSSNLCGVGSATAVTTNPTTYTWSCNGSGGGTNSSCTATRSAPIVNGSCGTANGGTFPNATPPSSNLCNAGSATAVTTNPTTYTWSCNGSGGGTNASCTATRAAAVVNGACSATPGVCNAGTVASDNGLTSCGTTRTWSCNGSGGGTNASCSQSNGACGGYNTCPSPSYQYSGAAFECNDCSYIGTEKVFSYHSCDIPPCPPPPTPETIQDSIDQVTAMIVAAGKNPNNYDIGVAQTSGSCPAPGCDNWFPNDYGTGYACPKVVNGACSATPGVCNAGTVASDNGLTSCGTTRTWNCTGSGGGTTANCSHNNGACAGVNGACGASHGVSTYTAPSSNLCNAGTATAVSGSGPFTWSCTGSGGGTTANCLAQLRQDGVCGTANGTSGAGAPTLLSQKCSVGTPSAISGTGPWTWTCSGVNGGTTANCSKNPPVPVNGVCGTSHGGTFPNSTPPSSNLCNTGPATAVTTNPTTYTWVCGGTDGGTNANCSATRAAPVVNGTCGTSNGGTFPFSTPPSSNLCSTGSATAVTTNPSTYTWSCNGSGGGSNGSCSATRAAAPVNGSCGSANGTGAGSAPSSNLCSAGTATPVSGTGPWTWSCNGSGGGTNASCSAPVLVNGTCGAANGVGAYSAPSSGLCSSGSATAVGGSGPFTWSCNGANGGSNASCSAPLRTDGSCGASHNGNFYTAPATGLCSAGTASAVGGSGPWTWTCAGTNGGVTANCNANRSINGVCGSDNSVSTPTAPTNPGLCSAGNNSSVTNSSNTWNWNCNGINGGTNASCSAPQQINGTCGPANGSSTYTAPSSGLCATGNATSVTGSGPFDWNCNGINGGTNASCSASLTVNGACGPAHGAFSSSAPTSGLCSAGTNSAVTGTGPFTWDCNGLNGGTTIGCSSQVVVQGTCGPSNNVPTATAPASGLCATGTATAVTGSGPWTWSCIGSGGGITSGCTAPTPPPPPTFGGACPS